MGVETGEEINKEKILYCKPSYFTIQLCKSAKEQELLKKTAPVTDPPPPQRHSPIRQETRHLNFHLLTTKGPTAEKT